MIVLNTLPRIFVFINILLFAGYAYSKDHSSATSFILIKNVKVWDGNSNQLSNNQDILIENHLIKRIGRPIVNPDEAQVIDGKELIVNLFLSLYSKPSKDNV